MKASRYKRGRFLAGGGAAGFGTMNSEIQIMIGERLGWGGPKPFGISAADHIVAYTNRVATAILGVGLLTSVI